MCKIINNKFTVGSISLSVASMVSINAVIEEVNNSYLQTSIFLELRPQKRGGGYGEPIKMLMSNIELRALSIAIKEIVRAKTTEYEKISNSGGSATTMKKLYLGTDNKNFFINLRQGSDNSVSVMVDKYKLLSFAEDIILLSESVTKTLFKIQQKRYNNQNNNQG